MASTRSGGDVFGFVMGHLSGGMEHLACGPAMSLRSLAVGAGGRLERAVNEDVITLAVTGLSRAGKTVFITSLIQNLLALAAQKDVLPRLTQRLSDRGVNRLRDVTILPAGASALPHFDHAAKLAGLS